MTNLLLIILLTINPILNSDWVLKKDDSEIKIYTRSLEGSSFDEFKGLTLIKNSSLTEVLEIILDVKNYETLYANCMDPKILKQEGQFYDIHYFMIEAPWPFENRDAIYEQKTTFNETKKKALVTLKPLPDFIDENEQLVRIKKGKGFWELEEDEYKNVWVTYQFLSDPGGDIPAWLTNASIISHPFKTLQNLKKRAEN